jgi:acyl-CoA thioester hydrolase
LKDFPPTDTVSYQHSFHVEEKHIDNLNHVNNVVYLQWVNDISEKHWEHLSNQNLNSKYFWVCLRHEIDYLDQAFLGEGITVYTWVGESKGVRSVRHVHIYKDDILLTKVSSTWCLIDAKTQKPARIKEDILEVLRRKE